MSTAIKLKKSAVAGRVPQTNDLAFGEIAINYADGVLYYKNADTVVKRLSASSIGVDSASVTSLIDSDYIQLRTATIPTFGTDYVDSAAAITLANTRITATLIDEDNMSSNSATRLPSQQSVKAYVDAQVATKDNTDEITEGSSNLYFTNARADARITNALLDEDNMSSNSATKVASQQSIKAYVDAQTLSLIDEDNMSSNSATRPPSQQSVKAYVDAQTDALTIQDEGSSLTTSGSTLNFVGAGVVASGTGATKTITIAGGGAGVTVQDEGSSLSTLGTTLNFVGSNVVASGTGTTKTITISDDNQVFDFGTFAAPVGFTLDMGAIV